MQTRGTLGHWTYIPILYQWAASRVTNGTTINRQKLACFCLNMLSFDVWNYAIAITTIRLQFTFDGAWYYDTAKINIGFPTRCDKKRTVFIVLERLQTFLHPIAAGLYWASGQCSAMSESYNPVRSISQWSLDSSHAYAPVAPPTVA